MNYARYLPIIIILNLIGCVTAEEPTKILDFDSARLSPQVIKLSSVASSISYIPLETTDTIRLSPQLTQITVAGDRILAYDNNTVKLFSISGEQISDIKLTDFRIPPFEIALAGYFIDTVYKTIRMLSRHYLYTYDMHGHLSDSCNIISRFWQNGLKVNPYTVNQHQVHGDKIAVFTNKDSVHISVDNGKSFPVAFSNIASGVWGHSHNGSYSIVPPWPMTNDYIATFDYNTGTYHRLYYDGHKTTPYIFKLKEGFSKSVTINRPTLNSIFETDRYLGIAFIGKTYDKYLYDKADDKLIYLGSKIEPMFVNDIDPGINIITMQATEDNRLYGLVDAGRFKKMAKQSDNPELQELAGKIKESDNPIVAVIKLK